MELVITEICIICIWNWSLLSLTLCTIDCSLQAKICRYLSLFRPKDRNKVIVYFSSHTDTLMKMANSLIVLPKAIDNVIFFSPSSSSLLGTFLWQLKSAFAMFTMLQVICSDIRHGTESEQDRFGDCNSNQLRHSHHQNKVPSTVTRQS